MKRQAGLQDIRQTELLVSPIEIETHTTDRALGKSLLWLFAHHGARLVPQSVSIWRAKIAGSSGIDVHQPHWASLGQTRIDGSRTGFRVGIGWQRRLTTPDQAGIGHESRDRRRPAKPVTLSVQAKPHRAIDWAGFAHP